MSSINVLNVLNLLIEEFSTSSTKASAITREERKLYQRISGIFLKVSTLVFLLGLLHACCEADDYFFDEVSVLDSAKEKVEDLDEEDDFDYINGASDSDDEGPHDKRSIVVTLADKERAVKFWRQPAESPNHKKKKRSLSNVRST